MGSQEPTGADQAGRNIMRITMNNINREAAELGYELVRGEGYFYFWPLDDDHELLWDSSIYTCHLTSYPVEDWIGILKDKIKETDAGGHYVLENHSGFNK
jgi:hypothetical protein